MVGSAGGLPIKDECNLLKAEPLAETSGNLAAGIQASACHWEWHKGGPSGGELRNVRKSWTKTVRSRRVGC